MSAFPSKLRLGRFRDRPWSKVTRVIGEDGPTLTTLPIEITLLIWMMLDAKTLLTVGHVCRRWRFLDNDTTFWRSIVNANQMNWQSFTNDISHDHSRKKQRKRLSTSSSSLRRGAPIGSAECDWKRCFAEQTRVQLALVREKQLQSLPPLLLLSTSSSHRPHRVFRCPVFGSGLGTSAKSLIYPMMLDNSSPFVRSRLYPGVLGIGSGVGIRVGPTELNLCSFYQFKPELLQQWRDFFARSQGFIFMLNPRRCEENLANARGLLHSLFFQGSHSISHCPLLVVGLHPPQEKEGFAALPALTPLDVVRELQIERLPCLSYNVVFLHGINDHEWTAAQSALRWLVSRMQQ